MSAWQTTPRTSLASTTNRPATTASGWEWAWRARSPAETETLQFPAGGKTPGLRSPRLARLEAVLLVANGPLSSRKLAQFATLADATEARTLIRKLNELYDRQDNAFRVEQVASGYQLLTRPVYAVWLGKVHQRQAELKLTPPALETLAIIAYRQPIIRADLEAIRGVSCTEMLKQLMDRGLVRIGGAEETLGRPHLYETTRLFLEVFGMGTLDDLPLASKLRRRPPGSLPESESADAA